MIIEITIFVLLIALFLAIWRIESRWRIIITPFIILMYYEFMRILPAFILSRHSVYGVATSYYPLIVAVIAFFFLIVGFMCGYFHKQTSSARVLALSQARGLKLRINHAESVGVFVVAVLLILLGLYFYGGVPNTVLSVKSLLLGSGSEDLAIMVRDQRFELTKAHYFGGEYRGQGIIRTLQTLGWSIICCYTLVVSIERRTINAAMVFFLSLTCSWVFVAGVGDRGPFLNLLVILIIVYSLRRPLRLRILAFFAAAIIAIGILLSLYSTKAYQLLSGWNSSNFIKSIVEMILERIFLGNAQNDIYVIELIESGIWQIRLGAIHWRDAITALPGVQYGMPLSYELTEILTHSATATTYRSGTYLSKVYADFGLWGVPMIYFIIGCLVGFVQRRVFIRRNNAWMIAISALIIFISGSIVFLGFIAALASIVAIAIIILIHFTVVWSVRGIIRVVSAQVYEKQPIVK